MTSGDTSVRVAVRIRPQLAKERIDMCQVCTTVTPGEPQVFIGKDRAFTYDFVHDTVSQQEEVFESLAKPLVDGCFDGYNATIFAYGQTGSGKTYTMGTGFDLSLEAEEIGIIPRAVKYLFDRITILKQESLDKKLPPPDFKVNAQFLELYNEEIHDLLDTTRDPTDKASKSHIKIHEDADGGIYTVGVTAKPVHSLQDTMQSLKMGALSRTTASTNMNAQSSRSHAIFTLQIKQQRLVKANEEVDGEMNGDQVNEFETLTAKFHFVDLAGSERLKRTGATGERQKEGISINCGLLALGNVISALGDSTRKVTHVPYRDSKLTRLLQDSLGGNSATMMIACVSPSDRDFMETLNTLKYANRARNIKNKLVANQDKTSKQIAELRSQVTQLQVELEEFKSGKRSVNADGSESFNDMYHENTMLQTENNNLRQRIKAMQETVEALTNKNTQLLTERAYMSITTEGKVPDNDEVSKLIEGYLKEIEQLRSKLVESEAMMENVKRSNTRAASVMSRSNVHSSMGISVDFELIDTDSQVDMILDKAKKDVSKYKKKLSRTSKTSHRNDRNIEAISEDEKQDHEEAEHVSDEAGANEDEEDEGAGTDEEVEESDNEDEEVLDVSSSDSDSEEDSEALHEDLADLTTEISIKEKLIEQLESSQKRYIAMREQYEQKMTMLQKRIKETEQERDSVLSSVDTRESQNKDKSKKVRDEYEKKLNSMTNELKKLKAAKAEHAKLIRNREENEKRLRTLQAELGDLKKVKVKLINQIKEEAQKNRRIETERARELAKIKKEQRLKDNQIRTLESERRTKEIMLQQRKAEIERLKRIKPMSDKARGRVGKYDKPLTKHCCALDAVSTIPTTPRYLQKKKFSPKVAKQKWTSLEKVVSSSIHKKQTISHMEKDMDRWLKQRNILTKKLEKFSRKRDLISEMKDEQGYMLDITDQIETLRDNISYVQDNINECQSNIMQFEETKEDEPETQTLWKDISHDEALYMLEKFYNFSIERGLLAAAKEAESKELSARLHQEKMDSALQRDMLQYLIRGKGIDIDVDESLLLTNEDESSESTPSSRSPSPVDPSILQEAQAAVITTQESSTSHTTASDESLNSQGSFRSKDKARRKTATPQDLLYVAVQAGPLKTVLEKEEKTARSSVQMRQRDGTAKASGDVMRTSADATLMAAPSNIPNTQRQGVMTRSSPSPSLETTSPSMKRHSLPPQRSATSLEPSPVMRRRVGSTNSSIQPSLSTQSSISTGSSEITPPTSPTPSLRQNNREETNVFKRLTNTKISPHNSSTRQQASAHPVYRKGQIRELANVKSTGAPLVHCYTAEGHTKAVLSVFATEDKLFSSSKDRTAKVWDLERGTEIITLSAHPNNVNKVHYAPETGIIFTVSTYFIKLWDERQGHKCIKTLASSGMATDGALSVSMSARHMSTCPSGETNINDIALSSTGTVLYSAAANNVRIWDLRSYKAVGKLSGGHQAAVMVLAVDDTDTADGNICVVTGSKDHYIKVFDVGEDSVGLLTPKYNLEPPHYDGIQSLCLMGDLLFSGSRDTCIKKWDLSEQQLIQSINNSHKDWICGLDFMPGGNCLLSGCRGGYLKLWNIDDCSQLGEIRAHRSPINAITTNENLIFTAANDKTMGVWKPVETQTD